MLYWASTVDVPVSSSPDLSVETVDPARDAVRRWFSLPFVRFIGAHTGCSCGFPSVIAEQPIEYFDGMFDDDEPDRANNLRSVAALLALVRDQMALSGEIQLYPIADGEEDQPPKGTIELREASLTPETFFFNERFLHRITGDRASQAP